MPVIMMLHGAGATGRWAMIETRWADVVERDRLHGNLPMCCVFPDALPLDPEKPAKFGTNPRKWDTAGDADVAFLRAIFNDLEQWLPIDSSRLYLTGFSNGADMTFRAGIDLSDVLAAIAPVAGYCNVDPRAVAERPIPTLYMVGIEDPLVPLAGGTVQTPWGRAVRRPALMDNLREWARFQGMSIYPIDDSWMPPSRVISCGPSFNGSEFSVFVIHGLGHHWPGGKGQLSEQIAGPRSNGMDATELISMFFVVNRMVT
jgi:polyhydroxybutyrate depolymerase